MKFKKIFAAVAAAAVAVSTMAVSAFAIKDYPDGYTLDLIAEGYDVTAVAGFTFKISGDIDSGVGGGVGFNSATTGWDSTEWGNDDANKAIKASNGEVTVQRDAPVFKESDVTDPTNPCAQIWMQQWWGSDVTIDAVIVLDKDGNALTAAAAPAAEETAAEATATEIWSGSNDLGTDWNGDNALKLDASLFANVAEGNNIEIEYTTGEADYFNLKIVENTDGWPALSSPTGVDPQWGTIGVEKGTVSYSFAISADDVAKIQANGMVIQGYGVTITKVAVSGAAAAAPVAEEKTEEPAPAEVEGDDEDVDEDVEDEPAAEPVADEPAPAPSAEETPAPAVENATAAPATGNTAVASVIAVMAVAGVAAIASKKRK